MRTATELRLTLSSIAIAAALLPAAAAAQAAPAADPAAASPQDQVVATPAQPTGDDDIVVTARQQSESLIRVPVAVTAVTGVELARTNATDLVKIAQLAPQVTVARSASGGGASFVIRGIGSQPQEPNLDQTVAINVDGVLVNRGRVATLGLFDLQQVEVLKGPQALFFGKNSPAGVISLVSALPTDTFTASGRVGYEFEAREKYAEAVVSGPLSDTLKARLAARYSHMDGWMINLAKPMPNPWAPAFPLPGAWADRVPGGTSLAGRLTLQWNPIDRFDATLRVFGATQEDNDFSGGQQVRCTAPTTAPSASGRIDPTGDCKFDQFFSKSALPAGLAAAMPLANGGVPYTDAGAILAGLTLNYRLSDALTLTSITGLLHLRSKGFAEYTGASTGQVWSGGQEKTDTHSQELRLISDYGGAINFTLGAFYEHSYRYTFAPQFINFRGQDPATGKYHTSERLARNWSDSYSAFGQLRWDIIDDLELAGGVRFTREEKRTSIGNVYVHANAVPAQAVVGTFIPLSLTSSNWSPEATLTWHPTEEQTLYAAYKTGYKSGGFANPSTFSRIFQNSPSLLQLANETAKGGEIGYKARLFGRAVRFEAAVYSYDFDNLVVSSYDVPSATFQVRNAAKARTRGIEASLNWRAAPGLNLTAAGGYNRAKYINFPGAPCYLGQTAAEGCIATPQPGGGTANAQNFAGRTLHRAPEWVVNLGATYDTALSSGLRMGLAGDASYTSSYWAQENLAPASIQDAFWRLGASVRVYTPDEKWELSLIGRNLTNEYYLTQGSDQPGGTKGAITSVGPRPREIAVQLGFRF
jgi:iron complex outermembrane receptor protein